MIPINGTISDCQFDLRPQIPTPLVDGSVLNFEFYFYSSCRMTIDGDAGNINSIAVGYQWPYLHTVDLDRETLRRIESNDPGVVALVINDELDLIEGAGRAIGNSNILRSLTICMRPEYVGRTDWCEELFRGIASNRSIESLSLVTYSEDRIIPNLDIFQILAPFFKHNRNLHLIDVTRCSPWIKSLALALSKCQKNGQLHCITLSLIDSTDEEVAALFDSLNDGNHSLLEVNLFHFRLKKMGCIALSNLLKNPVSKVQVLTLQGSNIDGECAAILSNALVTKNDLIELCLDECYNITAAGWHALSTFLSHPNCSLEKLWLTDTGIGDEGVTYLGDSLAVNKALKSLGMNLNDSITLEGWQAFSKCLRNPNSALEKIRLCGCDLDDESAVSLAWALTGNLSIKELNLGYNPLITANGWMTIFNYLLSCVPSLKELHISVEDDMTENEMAELETNWQDEMDWTVLSRALCDQSSIASTYSSNHTFHTLLDDFGTQSLDGLIPDETLTFLEMNKNLNKAEVARQKILQYHFVGRSANLHLFSRMSLTIMPYALEWIGRNRIEFSLMYVVIRDNPTLFDICHGPNVNGA